MKKYNVIWESVDLNEDKIIYKQREFEDVHFRDHFIKATDDDTKESYYIPYYRILEIIQIGETELNGYDG